jgi:hypothetical protein
MKGPAIPSPGAGVGKGGDQPHHHAPGNGADRRYPYEGPRGDEPGKYDHAKNHIQNQGQAPNAPTETSFIMASRFPGRIRRWNRPSPPPRPDEGPGSETLPAPPAVRRRPGATGWAKSIATGNRPQRGSAPAEETGYHKPVEAVGHSSPSRPAHGINGQGPDSRTESFHDIFLSPKTTERMWSTRQWASKWSARRSYW